RHPGHAGEQPRRRHPRPRPRCRRPRGERERDRAHDVGNGGGGRPGRPRRRRRPHRPTPLGRHRPGGPVLRHDRPARARGDRSMTATTAARPAPSRVAPPAVPFTRLARGELRKQVDTRAGLWLLAVIVLVNAGLIALVLFTGEPEQRTWQELTMASDRKSTRLNSSHVKISYAVFCL